MKLIVCDLDETLLDDQKRISKRNLEVIYKAQEQGNKFVVATGRGFTYIDSILESLHVLGKEDEYVISNNGAILTKNSSNVPLYFKGLDNDLAMKLIEFGLNKKLCVQVFTIQDVYAFNVGEDEINVLLSFKGDAIIMEHNDFSFLKEMNIVKVMYQNLDVSYLMSLENELSSNLKEQVNISYSSHRYMEFNAKGINKGSALRELLKLLNLTLDDVVAIGDNNNDLSMLEIAGVGAAVNNALQSVKEKCSFVSEFNNNESAVADVIERFVLNQES